VDPVRDVGAIADLMAEAFSDELDERGRAVLREMHWMARLSPFMWWWLRADPAFRDSFGGFVWEEPRPDERGMRIVGNVSLNPAPGNRQRRIICNVVVQGQFRRRGIARRLTETAIAEARRQGAAGVVLQVYQDNPAALHLYTNLGFHEAMGETELRLPAAVPTKIVDSPGYQVRPWRPADGLAIYDLACRVTPPVQGWLEPVREVSYRPDWWARTQRSLADLAAGRRTVRLVSTVCNQSKGGEQLAAMVDVTAAFREGQHQLYLLSHPSYEEQVAPILVSRALKILATMPPRVVRTTVRSDQRAVLQALKDHGFREHRTLLTLRKDFG
jgi:ribosomal protein S18 acetylase RimI-like enzyme